MTPLQRRYRSRRTGAEASSLLELREHRLDLAGVADTLAWGFTTGRRTLLLDVERVAHPWELPAPPVLPAALDPDARADRLWELLRAAVRTDAERPRCSLSGGLDSRAIAAAAADLPGLSLGTFGEADSQDVPVAAEVARALALPHTIATLPPQAARELEDRVFSASGGLGGPDAAPGSWTDAAWAQECDVLLSGTSGDVIWGDTGLGGRTPDSRLRKLGVSAVGDPLEGVHTAPPWASPSGKGAWANLWTRQARVTWNGVLPRLAHTAVRPVCWEPHLLAFCLALGDADRADRALLRRMLRRHVPAVASIPAVRGRPLDMDRLFASDPWWREELDEMAADRPAWARLGLNPGGVARLLRLVRDGRRSRAGLVCRLRVLRRWSHAQEQGGWS